ncbi:MAG: HPr family phosphocarrier protein [Eubacteriales bacterium]|nr:HPr family phosphocarrier protein [Eubacteriales bacterium]
MKNRKVVVGLPQDMERKVAVMVQVASQFDSRIHFITGNKKVNAKSIMGMMTIPLNSGDELLVEAEGADEEQAIEVVVEFLETGKQPN